MELYKPVRPAGFSVTDAQRYLLNSLLELNEIPFTASERDSLLSPKILGKIENRRTRPAFLRHFGTLLAEAVQAFFAANPAPRILELGTGSGTGALLFGLLGAHVIALDRDPILVSACRRRQRFYETRYGKLDVRFSLADVFEFCGQGEASAQRYHDTPRKCEPFDGVYSLFALNVMQPTTELLARLAPFLSPGGRLVISDGNRDGLYNRVFRPRRVLSPAHVTQLLLRHWGSADCGLRTANSEVRTAGCGLRFHSPLPKWVMSLADRLGVSRWLGQSYTLVAERGE
jgi:SAM-dependent methyltransferase